MQAKKIIAPDMRRALIKVRNELGDDAIILSNRKVPQGIELIATNDNQAHVAQVLQQRKEDQIKASQWADTDTAHAKQQDQQRKSEQKAQLAERIHKAKISAEKNSPTKDLPKKESSLSEQKIAEQLSFQQKIMQQKSSQQEAMASAVPFKSAAHSEQATVKHLESQVYLLKELLRNQSTWLNWGQFSFTQPIRSYLFQQLCRIGLSVTLIKSLIGQEEYQQLSDIQAAWRLTMQTLASRIPVLTDDLVDAEGIIALVGPTGSGKTTSIAKIATRHVQRYGNEQLALITTDAFRLGAQQQLDTLGNLLNVPVLVARSPVGLEKALAQLANKKLILVDTAGLTRRDPAWQMQLDTLQNASQKMRCLLTLSTTNQLEVLRQSAMDFASLHLNGSLLTKLDESQGLGAALSVIIEQNLPLAYVTCGLSIPDDIVRMDSMTLLKQAIQFGKNSKNLDDAETLFLWSQSCAETSEDALAIAV